MAKRWWRSRADQLRLRHAIIDTGYRYIREGISDLILPAARKRSVTRAGVAA